MHDAYIYVDSPINSSLQQSSIQGNKVMNTVCKHKMDDDSDSETPGSSSASGEGKKKKKKKSN